MTACKDLTGMKFGKLLVLRKENNISTKLKKQGAWWKCQCDCGNIKIIRSNDLRNDRPTKSCGCSKLEHCTTHNSTHTSEYEVWKGIRRRCHNVNYRQYKDYGGRGVKVCESWRHSFENFYNDMGPKPDGNYFIERIDNNDDYKPSNCIWATRTQQNRNRNYNKVKNMNDANHIRNLYATGNYSYEQLAKQYNCTETNIYEIIKYRTWT